MEVPLIVEVPEDYYVVGAIVLYKAITPDGSFVFREQYSNDLTIMEKYGMVTSAHDTVRERIQGTARPPGSD